MEISKALDKIDLSKFDLFKNSSLNEIFGQLQDFTSDNKDNITDFKKFKMIITQVNAFKELTESNSHSTTILSLVNKIETLGLDNNTAKWAVKLVADKLSIKHGLVVSKTQPNNQITQASVKSVKSSQVQISKTTSFDRPQAKPSKPKPVSKPKPTSSYVVTPRYNQRTTTLGEASYNLISFIFALLSIGAIILQINLPQTSLFAKVILGVFIVVNIVFLGLSINDSYDLPSWLFFISAVLSAYVLLLVFGLGYIFSGLLLASIFVILVGLAIMFDDALPSGWYVVMLGISLVNVALIGGDVISNDIAFYSTLALSFISLISAWAMFSDYEETVGTFHVFNLIGNVVQFLFIIL